MEISLDVFTIVKNWVFWLWSFLDGISVGGLFSLLDLFLALLFISAFIPVVLNLRSVESVSSNVSGQVSDLSAYYLKHPDKYIKNSSPFKDDNDEG